MSKKVSVITVVALLIGTCAPSFAAQAYKKAEKSTESMRKTREEIEKAKVQKDKTMAALEQLVGQSGGDLRKPYKKFADELKKLDKSSEKVRKIATDMRAKNQDYFKAWEQELSKIQNPDLQKKAGQRRSEAVKKFEEVSPKMQEARDLFVSFMANLQDINSYLGTDLSPGGIATISDMVKETQDQSKAVDDGIAKIMQALEEFAAEFSSQGS